MKITELSRILQGNCLDYLQQKRTQNELNNHGQAVYSDFDL